MAGKLIKRVLGQLGLTQVRYVAPVRIGAGPNLVRQVYRLVEKEFGVLAPPMALHSPSPQVLAASWLMLRETLIVTGEVERAAKEAVSAAVSVGNTCPFCITIHSTTLTGLTGLAGLPARVNDPSASVADPAVREAEAWARDSGTSEGARRHEPACPADQAPELIGTAVVLEYLNRMVNVFLGSVPLPPGVPKMALGGVMRVLGGMIQKAARQPHVPGQARDLLPPAPLPGDIRWAAERPAVADAMARACAAIEAAGARSAPAVVRETVLAELANWHGEQRGPSRAWVEDIVSGLPAAHQASGRFALLIAFASYQVDRSVIDQVRRECPDDATLIELASWASLAAARRAGSWIPVRIPEMAADTVGADEGA